MPSLTITIEDNSPLITYSSEWGIGGTVDNSAHLYSQNSFTSTNTGNASALFTFNGTKVEIFGAKRGNHGSYQVKLDDMIYPAVSGNSVPDKFQVSLFSSGSLGQGLHHLTLINNENHYLDVDFITWETQIGTEQDKIFVNTFQDTDPSFTYLPSEMSWTTSPDKLGSFSGGTGHATVSSEASCVYTFSGGEGVSLYGPIGPSNSPFGAQLDGGSIMNLTSNKQFSAPQTLLYHVDSLGSGPHQLKLLYQPTVPIQVFAIDYAVVLTTSPPSPNPSPNPTPNPTPLESHGSSGLTSLTVGMITGMIVSVVLLLACLSWFLYQRRRWIQGYSLQSSVEPYVPQRVPQGFVTTSAVPGTTPGLHNSGRQPPQHLSISSSDPSTNSYSLGLNVSTLGTTPAPFSAGGHAEGSGAVPVENEGLPPDYSVHANHRLQ